MSLNKKILTIASEDKFELSDKFIENYKNKEPNWGPIGKVTYLRTYAREKDDGTREEWWETIKRVVEGTYTIQRAHCQKLNLPWNAHKAQKSAQEMYRLMFEFKFLPPGRGLFMMGTDYVYDRGAASLNNCAFCSTKDIQTDFAEPFCFLMDMSMLGVGVGSDTKGEGLLKIKQPKIVDYIHQVEDSREGWVNLLRIVLNSYVGRDVLPKEVDFSKVRPYGQKIKSFGGTSSGPQPLMDMIHNIDSILRPCIDQFITSTNIVDLYNCIAKCVVSGNVRRSATIMLGNLKDEEFLNLKDYNLNRERMEKWGWASNNSVIPKIGENYDNIAKRIMNNGEPGIYWLENAQKYSRMNGIVDNKDELADGVNPCAEQTLESYELCCLVETFPAHHETIEEYRHTLKYAYLYAKTVTLIPTHNSRTNAVMLRNRRIGTSQSGIVQSINKHGLREHMRWCDEGYSYLKNVDKKYSKWLCIPESIKITSVKPSGTISLLCGATPGIHFPHSEYYFRTMRFDKGSDLVLKFKNANYRVEDDVVDPSAAVVYFAVREENFSKSKKDVTIWEQLELAAQMQQYWADNQVSITVTFDKEREGNQINAALQLYETRLKSVSFLPMQDHRYAQAPYQEITKEIYEEYIKNVKPVNFSNNENHNVEQGGKYCDGDTCYLKK